MNRYLVAPFESSHCSLFTVRDNRQARELESFSSWINQQRTAAMVSDGGALYFTAFSYNSFAFFDILTVNGLKMCARAMPEMSAG